MDKKSLLYGMSLGAMIAFGGMILGGQGPGRRQAKFDVLEVDQLHVREMIVKEKLITDEMKARRVTIINARGNPLIELREMVNLGLIRVNDEWGQELVRISGILRGGGSITTLEKGRAMVTINSTPDGGAVTVKATQRDGKSYNSAILRGATEGGYIQTMSKLYMNDEGKPAIDITDRMPLGMDDVESDEKDDAAQNEPAGE